MQKQVFHIITGLETGGAERMLVKLLGATDPAQISHRVVSLTGPGTLGAEVKALGVPLHDLQMEAGRPSLAALWRLRGLIKTHRPDVIQTWLYHADFMGLLARAISGLKVPLAWNLRCSDMDMSKYSQMSLLVLRACASFAGFPQAVLVNSRAGQRVHEGLGYKPKQWVFLPNGFDIERFQFSAEKRAAIRNALNIPEHAFVLGMLARFDPQKDYDLLIDAFSIAAKQNPSLHLLLAGRGVTAEEDFFLAARDDWGERLHLLGERRDVPDVLSALDVSVLSSAYGEGFSNSLGEAMACGRPAIATDVGDARQIIGDCGWIVPPRNKEALAEEALAEAMLAAAALEPSARAEMGDAARRRVVENWSMDVIAAGYTQVWQALAAGKPVPELTGAPP